MFVDVPPETRMPSTVALAVLVAAPTDMLVITLLLMLLSASKEMPFVSAASPKMQTTSSFVPR